VVKFDISHSRSRKNLFY